MIHKTFRFNQLTCPIQSLISGSKLKRDDQQVTPSLVMELKSGIFHGMNAFIIGSGRDQRLLESHIAFGIDVIGHHGIPIFRCDIAEVMVPLTSDVGQTVVQTSQSPRNSFPLLTGSLVSIVFIRKRSGYQLVVLFHHIARKKGCLDVQTLDVLRYPSRLQLEQRLVGRKLHITLRVGHHNHTERPFFFQSWINRYLRFSFRVLCQSPSGYGMYT